MTKKNPEFESLNSKQIGAEYVKTGKLQSNDFDLRPFLVGGGWIILIFFGFSASSFSVFI